MVSTPQEWFKNEHLKSISGTGFSVVNNWARIRNRWDHWKRTESLLEVVVYLIRRLAQFRYLVHLAQLGEK